MNADLDCLSLMELMELREGVGDLNARAHLKSCPRCRALLATMPSDLALPEPTGDRPAAPADAPRRRETGAVGVRTGAVWRARGEDDDIAWVVVVIGRVPDGDDRV